MKVIFLSYCNPIWSRDLLWRTFIYYWRKITDFEWTRKYMIAHLNGWTQTKVFQVVKVCANRLSGFFSSVERVYTVWDFKSIRKLTHWTSVLSFFLYCKTKWNVKKLATFYIITLFAKLFFLLKPEDGPRSLVCVLNFSWRLHKERTQIISGTQNNNNAWRSGKKILKVFFHRLLASLLWPKSKRTFNNIV